jgi:hypothetical protein
MNQTAGSIGAAPCRQSHVSVQRECLAKVIAENADLVNALESKIQSVIRPSSPQPCEKEPKDKPAPLVDLAEEIKCRVEEIRAANMHLTDILNRIEV